MSEIVEVIGIGEVVVKPTISLLELCITSQKETLELCRASVEKRKPYVYQTLLNHKTRESDITEMEEIREKDGNLKELIVTVSATLPIREATEVISLLMEKLGSTVSIQQIGYLHSCESLSESRIKAGKRAAEEAKLRAADMAEAVGSVLGPCLEIVEEACTQVATTHDKRESWVVDTALRQQETHVHTPIIVCTTLRARFSLLAYGAPKKKKS
ncbi:interleukin-1 receptor-associated kinase 1-binding protein 1 homolog [Macrobrachium nipponense]|uniref:interleukin-1 receptor-associated kinase 1-binding protein 1 homolog n=1 Tax=Macrobrachium nipponense TaxID=159736 RepID=UPI0030C7F6EE